jgi:D-amino-acid dehydrogenase
MIKLLLNCNTDSYRTNKERMLRIAQYSRDSLQILRKELSLDYEQRSLGTLQIFRHEKQMLLAQNDMQILEQCGINYQLLNPHECLGYEPGLGSMGNELIGGLRLPDDETGDCFRFTQALAQKCKNIGVKFIFDHEVLSLETEKKTGSISQVTTNKGIFKADAYVMALGCYSAALLTPLNINLPVYPVKGYSLTVPIKNEGSSPMSTVMDETYKVAVSRFNKRIRVGGTAELTGFNLDLPISRHENLNFVLNDLFPNAADMSQAQYWTGLRPMTPDGTPILGSCHINNLYINTGHGTLGWTMAVGSAKYVTDIINGKKPEISTEGLSLARYV